jgi:hypothetical protein
MAVRLSHFSALLYTLLTDLPEPPHPQTRTASVALLQQTAKLRRPLLLTGKVQPRIRKVFFRAPSFLSTVRRSNFVLLRAFRLVFAEPGYHSPTSHVLLEQQNHMQDQGKQDKWFGDLPILKWRSLDQPSDTICQSDPPTGRICTCNSRILLRVGLGVPRNADPEPGSRAGLANVRAL